MPVIRPVLSSIRPSRVGSRRYPRGRLRPLPGRCARPPRRCWERLLGLQAEGSGGTHAAHLQVVRVACRLTPIRPPVVNRQGRPVTPAFFSSVLTNRVASPSSPTFVSRYWLRGSSPHQTPIGDLVRSVVATPCPRNTSVPSLVQSKSSWLFVQLAPGSRKGQSSSEKRSSALHECWEGRWDANQGLRMPGVFHEAIA
jgi:hypothetical protein